MSCGRSGGMAVSPRPLQSTSILSELQIHSEGQERKEEAAHKDSEQTKTERQMENIKRVQKHTAQIQVLKSKSVKTIKFIEKMLKAKSNKDVTTRNRER